MRGITGMVLLLLFAAWLARAEVPSIAAAERAAAAGDYHTAVQDYEQALRARGFSAPLLFNLGNAWLRLGKSAPAILAYERALVMEPDSAAIKANLAAAQQRAGLAPPVVGPWLAAARYFTFDTYVWAGLAAVWLLCLALVLLCFSGTARRFARPLILVAALALCVSTDAAALCWTDLYRAVVQEPTVLQVAPAASASANGSLRAGEVVWIQDRYAGYEFVRTSDGHTGWASAAAVVAIRTALR
jgi:hypothetical protein